MMGRSITRNAYSYAGANPINYTDHSGKFFWMLAYVAAAAAAGAIIGGALAGLQAGVTYDWAKAGHCGCEKQQWAERTNRDQFVQEAAQQGAAIGAVLGAAAALGPLGELVVGFAGFGMGVTSGADALRNFVEILNNEHSASWCAMLDFMAGLTTAVVGLHQIKSGIHPHSPGDGGIDPGTEGHGGNGTDGGSDGSHGGNGVDSTGIDNGSNNGSLGSFVVTSKKDVQAKQR